MSDIDIDLWDLIQEKDKDITRLRSLLKEAGEALDLVIAWAPSPILSEHTSSLEFAQAVLSKIKGEV